MEHFKHIELTEEEEFACYQVYEGKKRHEYKNMRVAEMLKQGLAVLEIEAIIESELERQIFELTKEESEFCVLTAKEDKYYRNKAIAYNESLRLPKVYQKPTKEEYLKQVQQKLFELVEIENTPENYRLVINEDNENAWKMLGLYFTKDPLFQEYGYSLNKGIMIHGPVGCGKTTILKAFSKNLYQPYSIVSCRSIADLYSKGGSSAISKYFDVQKNSFPHLYYGFQQLGWMFDDLGTEDNKKHFGDELNVMAEVLLNWAERIGLGFNKIHATTNLTADQLEDKYGTRLRSRFRQMFNLIEFSPTVKDKRK